MKYRTKKQGEFGEMKTLRDEVIELLKTGWFSNFQINIRMKSSSADRIMRFIRENPPQGFIIEQRKKVVPEGYRNCLEYTLKEVEGC